MKIFSVISALFAMFSSMLSSILLSMLFSLSFFVLTPLYPTPTFGGVYSHDSQSENTPIYFIFDLDETLVHSVSPSVPVNQLSNPTKMIPLRGDILGQRYQVLNGAGELIQSLLVDVPRSRIMFFSAGSHEKNIQILRELKLPDGRSALEVSDRVMSYQFLTQVKTENGNPIFASKKALRKDLRKARPLNGDLERVMLIDNSPKWSLPGQEGNLLWVEPEKNQRANQGANLGSNLGSNQNKLVWVRGVIDRVLEEAQVRGISPKQVLTQLQWTGDDPSNWVYKEELSKNESLYQRGLRLLQRHNPKFQLVGQPLGDLGNLQKESDQLSIESVMQRRESAKARIQSLDSSCIEGILKSAMME